MDCLFARTSDDRAMASALVNHLVAISPGNRDSVWKANLRIVAGLITIWGPSLSIRKMDLLYMLNKKDEASLSFLSPGDRVVATGKRPASDRFLCPSLCGDRIVVFVPWQLWQCLRCY
jgi:hypothetical protein